MNDEALREAFHYLKAVQRDFPGGIPRSLIVETKEERIADKPQAVRVLFLLSAQPDWVSQAGVLLKGAIENGLKLNLSECAFLSATQTGKNNNLDSITQEIQRCSPTVVIVCGYAAATALKIPGGNLGEIKNADHQLNGSCVIVTEALEDVVVDSNLKRVLWNDLKRALSLLSKDLK